MPEYTKADVERSARNYFSSWARLMDSAGRNDLNERSVANWTKRNIVAADTGIAACDDELRTGNYSEDVLGAAEGLIREAPAFEDISKQLLCRAMRQAFRYWKHRMEAPALPFTPDDPFFDFEGSPFRSETIPTSDADISWGQRPPVPFPTSLSLAEGPKFPTLSQLIERFNERLERKRVGESHIDEIGRALRWLQEELGEDRPVDTIGVDDLRSFRDNVVRMDASRRGRQEPFRKRLTDRTDRQITFATATKYWSAVKMMFDWALQEGLCPSNPAGLLKMERPKGEVAKTPEPYSRDELVRFYSTPLYDGYKSLDRTMDEGPCRYRGQHWWAGVLPLFTGMRAGELSQLLPSDFFFEGPIPHLRVHEFDGEGQKTKFVKAPASIRNVPLAPILLQLGLRQFVENRRRAAPKARVFERFRLGTRGKRSEGMTRYWGHYLREFNLHTEGRSTHVWRHTVIERLRILGAHDEEIAGFVGHGIGTQTSKYGTKNREAMPLARLQHFANKLDYGFDLVSLLGGPYQDGVHRCVR